MVITELGMVTDVSPSHPENAPSPMLVTELGMVTEARPEHLEYLQLVVCQLILAEMAEK